MHPELSGCITMEVANFGAAMDTLIDQDECCENFIKMVLLTCLLYKFIVLYLTKKRS